MERKASFVSFQETSDWKKEKRTVNLMDLEEESTILVGKGG